MEERIKKAQQEELEKYRDRQKRLEQFGQMVEGLREHWKPRLDVLLKKFGDRIKATPRIHTSGREAVFAFDSSLARVELKLAAYADPDVRNIIFTYDLEIIPVLMKFDKHSEIQFPLNAVDAEALGKWLDDRLVGFVETYLSLQGNEYYLKDSMVEDPVVKIRFSKFAAGATIQEGSKTLYFINEETRREYEKTRAGAK